MHIINENMKTVHNIYIFKYVTDIENAQNLSLFKLLGVHKKSCFQNTYFHILTLELSLPSAKLTNKPATRITKSILYEDCESNTDSLVE